MKYNHFLKLLSFTDKLRFSIGVMSEKLVLKGKQVQELKTYRNMLLNIQQLGFSINFKEKEVILNKENTTLFLRQNSSDIDVFNQVFVREEYLPLIDCVVANNFPVNTIIDAGSNIGLTSAKFLQYFGGAKIICLEPDSGNFLQIQKNLAAHKQQITALQLALWNKQEKLYVNTSFRDGKEWGRSVSSEAKNQDEGIDSITFEVLIEQHHITRIDILKIDIEGSEAIIFKKENNLEFLEITKIMAIEIHDEFNCREEIYEILRSKNFVLFNAGELTIAINESLR